MIYYTETKKLSKITPNHLKGEKKKNIIGYNMCNWNAKTFDVKAMRNVGHQNQIGNSG
jgi:hypothetical protein